MSSSTLEQSPDAATSPGGKPNKASKGKAPAGHSLQGNPFVPPPSGKCPINDLPPEILAHIFTIGTRAQEDEDEDDIDEEGIHEDDGDDAYSDVSSSSSDDEPEFQVLVSHVCKHWRTLATGTPGLWTTLTFNEPRPFEKAQAYIERSKTSPLLIAIDATKDDDDAVDMDVDGELESGALAQAGKSCDVTGGTVGLTLDDVDFIADLIIPHVERWQRFELMVSDFAIMHKALSRMAECTSAPLLEGLQLYHYEDCEDYEIFSPKHLRAPLLPFHGNAPRLTEVALWGVHIDWTAACPATGIGLLHGLTGLELAYHAQDVRPPFSDFASMLLRSPQLDTLTICCSGPIIPVDGGLDAWPAEPLVLSELKNLVLAFHEPEYVAAIVARLHIPALRSLALELEGGDFTDFTRQLIAPLPSEGATVPSLLGGSSGAKPESRSMLSGLEALKISGLPCSQEVIREFYLAIPQLHSLNINLCHTDIWFFIHLAFPDVIRTLPKLPEDADDDDVLSYLQDLPKPPHGIQALCPHLETLTTTGVSGGVLRALVDTRRYMGHPIKRLFVNEDDDVGETDYKYLKDHVEEVEFFEGSDDDETDDDDIEGFGPEPPGPVDNAVVHIL
ncbi:hypothetical protein BD410DRAFT_788809 [Rickenella mellea]|uniref:Uncharacterized protein n=1 Tax=Rickenella mellea TaxID=50990 RepID=A0A4Y7Q5C5_9AGAM|nr:hypothetical protein BD410DRAFT_788809 [Rickenella mellea]